MNAHIQAYKHSMRLGPSLRSGVWWDLKRRAAACGRSLLLLLDPTGIPAVQAPLYLLDVLRDLSWRSLWHAALPNNVGCIRCVCHHPQTTFLLSHWQHRPMRQQVLVLSSEMQYAQSLQCSLFSASIATLICHVT